MLPTLQLDRAPVASTRQIEWAEFAERTVGLLLLVISFPLLLVVSIAISLLSRRSPFVAHLRIAKHNRPFWMLKLRSMWERNAPSQWGWIEFVVADPVNDQKGPKDPRVTSRFAAFCRRHSIDELPQFWHVARGEMALVGPRPLTRSEIDHYYGAHASELVSVKPGLTGLWQVGGRSNIKFPQRATMDLQLVRQLTPKMYLSILLRTVITLVGGQGAW